MSQCSPISKDILTPIGISLTVGLILYPGLNSIFKAVANKKWIWITTSIFLWIHIIGQLLRIPFIQCGNYYETMGYLANFIGSTLAVLSYGVLLALRFYKGSLLVTSRRWAVAIIVIGVVLGGVGVGIGGGVLQFLDDFSLYNNYQKNPLSASLSRPSFANIIISIGLLMDFVFNTFLFVALLRSNKNSKTNEAFKTNQSLILKASWIFFVILWLTNLSNLIGIIGSVLGVINQEASKGLIILFISNWNIFAPTIDIWCQVISSDLFKLLVKVPTHHVSPIRSPVDSKVSTTLEMDHTPSSPTH